MKESKVEESKVEEWRRHYLVCRLVAISPAT